MFVRVSVDSVKKRAVVQPFPPSLSTCLNMMCNVRFGYCPKQIFHICGQSKQTRAGHLGS